MLRKSLLISIVIILLISNPSGLQQVNAKAAPSALSWETRANMPTPRYAMGATAATNGKIYVAGGDNYTGTHLTVFEEYTPTTNSWRKLADMPTGRWRLGLASGMNGKLYAIGGNSASGLTGIVEEYNPATDTWATRANMPTAREGFGIAAANDGKIYVMGGRNDQGNLSTVEAYDPVTNSWTTCARMSTNRTGLGAATAINGKIYAIGSAIEVEEYDPGKNLWVRRADLPIGRVGLGVAAASNGKIYAVGGSAATSLTTVEEYDPLTDTWSSGTDMPTARHDVSAVATNDGQLYAIGGWGGGPLATVESTRVTDERETIVVPFVDGTTGVTTSNSYSGTVVITVSGVGQAAGTQWSDAFYIYTDAAGQPIIPWHPTGLYNSSLWINGGPVDGLLTYGLAPIQSAPSYSKDVSRTAITEKAVVSIPPYNPTHIYSFTINAPGGPLTFAVGDTTTGDNTGSYTVKLALSPPLGCLPLASAIHPKVLILTYNPWLVSQGMNVFDYEMWNSPDPSQTSEQMRFDLCKASGGFVDIQFVGRIDRNEFPIMTDGLRMSESEYLSLYSQGIGYSQAHPDALIDMSFAMVDNNINPKVKNHEVDEVWMFGVWTMSNFESRMGGPGAYWINGPTFQADSGRAYAVMGFEDKVGVPNSLHSLGHRVECTLDQAYGYFGDGKDTPWARFRKHANMLPTVLPGVPYGVGDTENPPNSTGAYDYTNQTIVYSTADDWFNFPYLTGATQPVNAQTWGNSDYGYYKWWYGHMPKAEGASPKSTSAPNELRQNNWWKYIFQFNRYPELVGLSNIDGASHVYLPLIKR